MRQLVSIGFILVLLSKLIYGVVFQVHFYWNQKEITRLECENKDRPEMKCNGKCYLAKQLEKAENELQQKKSEQQKTLKGFKLLESESFISLDNFSLPTISFFDITVENQLIFYQSLASQTHLNAIFHPPIFG
ncbi:MAG: hypothetical protein RL264_2089 [Bacteroidota bacterium]